MGFNKDAFDKDKDAPSFPPRSRSQKPSDKDVVKVTFHQFRNDVRAMTSRLREIGCAGRHVAVVGKMSYDWAVVYLAVLSAGGVLVPLDRDWHEDTLADTATMADVELLFCDEDCASTAEAIAGALRTRLIDTLITDEHTAKQLLALS